MATLTLIVGFLIFAGGIAGQLVIGRRFSKTTNPGDRRSVRVVLTLAAIIIGAWITIASGVALLHSHAHTQHPANNGS